MTSTTGIRVSIDVGCYQHSVAVGLADGQLLDEFDIDHEAAGFSEFFKLIDAPGTIGVKPSQTIGVRSNIPTLLTKNGKLGDPNQCACLQFLPPRFR